VPRIIPTAGPPTLVAFDPSRLLEAFFAGRKERTISAYRADLEDFRAFVGVATMGEASNRLRLQGTHDGAPAPGRDYQSPPRPLCGAS
jgi:hypothetical protein